MNVCDRENLPHLHRDSLLIGGCSVIVYIVLHILNEFCIWIVRHHNLNQWLVVSRSQRQTQQAHLSGFVVDRDDTRKAAACSELKNTFVLR